MKCWFYKLHVIFPLHTFLSLPTKRKISNLHLGDYSSGALKARSQGWLILLSLGESMKRPAVTDSVSDIFELDDSTPTTANANNTNANNGTALMGLSRGTSSGLVHHQAQAHQYLQHNCNPRLNHNVNSMSIETDVWRQNGNFFKRQSELCSTFENCNVKR